MSNARNDAVVREESGVLVRPGEHDTRILATVRGEQPAYKTASSWIRARREDAHIKPSDIERITRSIAESKGMGDFYVSHSTLADIEAGSIPSIHKLYALASALKLPLDRLLLAFGLDLEEVKTTANESAFSSGGPGAQVSTVQPRFRFRLNFDSQDSSSETILLNLNPQELATLLSVPQNRVDPMRYRYALIGSKDDTLADIVPPRSLVQIDITQRTVQVFSWQTLRERPIYLIWHAGGHTCAWCQIDRKDLTLIPHPLSHHLVRRLKMPGEATIIGKVTGAWLPFESLDT